LLSERNDTSMVELSASLGAQSAALATGNADTLDSTTKSFTGLGHETKQLVTGVKESMSLIDRFYNGGNRARPAALDILVVVLDGVVKRMRQQYAGRKQAIDEGNANITRLNASIASIVPKQAALQSELEEKRDRAKALRAAVGQGEETIITSVHVARNALEKARLLSRKNEKADIASLKLSVKGYDGKGRALTGREVNLRKKDGGPAARKPGDMAQSDDIALLARVSGCLCPVRAILGGTSCARHLMHTPIQQRLISPRPRVLPQMMS
jgi:hypothetical protein